MTTPSQADVERAQRWCTEHLLLRYYDLSAETVQAVAELITAAKAEERTQAEQDVLAERVRQRNVEGWSEQHDDEHADESLAQVAACYALPTALRMIKGGYWTGAARYDDSYWVEPKWSLWPDSWNFEWWKPKDRRCDLVRAGALILAEIERLDRIAKAIRQEMQV